MTQKDLKTIIKMIATAYPRQNVAIDRETLDIWYECTKHMDYKLARQAIVSTIQTCEFPPTISEFCKEYNEIKADYDKKMHEIWMCFDVGSHCFPFRTDNRRKELEEAYSIFLFLTVELANDDLDKSLRWAQELKNKSRKDFDLMEASPEKRRKFPSYKEYLQGLKDGIKHEP